MSTPVTVHEIADFVWIVDIGTRVYRAEYINDEEVFPLDRWRVRNANRRQYLSWDSPTLDQVVSEIRRFKHRQRLDIERASV